jgi:hypothetical protein
MGDIPEPSILRGEHPVAAAEERQRLILDMRNVVGPPPFSWPVVRGIREKFRVDRGFPTFSERKA